MAGNIKIIKEPNGNVSFYDIDNLSTIRSMIGTASMWIKDKSPVSGAIEFADTSSTDYGVTTSNVYSTTIGGVETLFSGTTQDLFALLQGSFFFDPANNVLWGHIGGTLASQTDLQNALDAKLNAPANTIFVGNGLPITTIADGIASAILLTPTALNPIKVDVASGVYPETSIVVPQWVALVGANSASTIISGSSGTILTQGLNSLVKGFTLDGNNASIGLNFTGSTLLPYSRIKDSIIRNCTTGILSTVAACLYLDATTIEDSCPIHADLQNAGINVFSLLSILRTDRIIGSATIQVLYIDPKDGFNKIHINNDVVLGSTLKPSQMAVGEGESYVSGMKVFTNTNIEAGTWDDITDTVKDLDAASAPIFPSTIVGSTFFTGADELFSGVKMTTTLEIIMGGGGLAIEYWNGMGWMEFDIMVTESEYPYSQNGNQAFGAVGKFHFRFGMMMSWAKNTVNGELKYWARVRVVGAPITQVPEIDIIELNPNAFEINRDGFTEYFGRSEPMKNLEQISLNAALELVGQAPKDQDILYSTNISLKQKKNKLEDGNNDGLGLKFTIPCGLDTSRPIMVRLDFYQLAAGVGDIQLSMTYALVPDGSIIDGALTETEVLLTAPVSGVENKLQFVMFSLDVAQLKNMQKVALSLRRIGGDVLDTFGGDVAIEDISARFMAWR